MSRLGRLVLFAVLAMMALGLAACGEASPEVVTVEVPREVTVVVEKVVTKEVPVEVSRVVEKIVTVEVPQDPSGAIPFAAAWIESGHADAEAEAFRHWDEEDPVEVPAGCAQCHSTYGYLDFLGADGTEAGVVDSGHPADTTVECIACHNEATLQLTSVVFPSGVEIGGLGDEARCMVCHQGRASKASVDGKIEAAGVTDVDAVSEGISFTNIHYFAAAATQAGSTAHGGYEYEGKMYDAKFAHVEGYDTCVGCHDPHTLEIKVDECATCHTNVSAVEDLRDVRMAGSLVDFDGDGDADEGIYYEFQGLQEVLYAAMQAYSSEVAGTGLVYDAASYPYFFTDAGERYATWTARLSKAAYNYQTSLKDPGAYAHGGKYLLALLYDSIADLSEALDTPVDMAAMHRIDHGHFAGSEEAFRHWDEDGEVSASCAKCHSATGLPTFLKEGVNVSAETANGFLCSTCHSSATEYTLYEVGSVEFPSGLSVDSGAPTTNLCMNCHQGRQSTVSMNAALDGLDPDAVSSRLRFQNVHYFAAGATLFGTEAQGAYEYPGVEYPGRNAHVPAFDDCTECHSAHRLEVKAESCGTCHPGVETTDDLHAIRLASPDADGDGDSKEGVAAEVEGLHAALYEAMRTYAKDVAGTGIVYNAGRYPYYFNEAGENFATWTPRLLKAAYNYQYVAKDPGAFAHNPKYILQILQSALADLTAVEGS